MSGAAIDRLTLNLKRIDAMAIASWRWSLPDPIGKVVTSSRQPNGLEVGQVRVPLGVIFMIYESRPNVTVDAAALCVKSGNAAILRGGKEAIHTNRMLHRILADELTGAGFPQHAVQLVPTTDRAAVGLLLGMPEWIDLAIPRGGESLIRRVAAEARMPVLKHYQGICHVYVNARCDLDMAIKITLNAKVQHPAVCNAAETREEAGAEHHGDEGPDDVERVGGERDAQDGREHEHHADLGEGPDAGGERLARG